MTRRVGDVIYIEMECGMKDPQGTSRRMHQYLRVSRDET